MPPSGARPAFPGDSGSSDPGILDTAPTSWLSLQLAAQDRAGWDPRRTIPPSLPALASGRQWRWLLPKRRRRGRVSHAAGARSRRLRPLPGLRRDSPNPAGRHLEARASRSRAAPARTGRTRGSNRPNDPAEGFPSLLRPLHFIYIPSSPAANQNEEGSTHSQSGSGDGSIARSLSFSNRRLGRETQF